MERLRPGHHILSPLQRRWLLGLETAEPGPGQDWTGSWQPSPTYPILPQGQRLPRARG